MGKRHSERQTVVARSPQECFDALAGIEGYPRWQAAVRAAEVHSLDHDGRARRVSLQMDTEIGPLRFTLDYGYEPPHLITWRFVEGDVRDANGEIVLEDRGDGTTLATYAGRIDPGASVTAVEASLLNDRMTEQSIEDLRARVESIR